MLQLGRLALVALLSSATAASVGPHVPPIISSNSRRHAPAIATSTLDGRELDASDFMLPDPSEFLQGEEMPKGRPLSVMIAGGGIGGLCAALAKIMKYRHAPPSRGTEN